MPDDRLEVKEQSPFAEARVLAAHALDLAERHRIPPFPRAYEVWFTYASGGHSALSERIDAMLHETGTLPPGAIDQLHAEYLSTSAMNAGVERIGERVNADLGQLVDVIEGGSMHGDALLAKINRAEKALIDADDTAERRRRVAELVRETRHHVRGISGLGENLETMRTQFMAMQRELRELRQSVLLDALTQLPNSRFFDDAVVRMAEEASGAGRDLALILLDLDHFDAFNQRWGRKAGDVVLTKCAAVLRQVLREGDVAMRIGGDTFAMLLPGMGAPKAQNHAEGLKRSVAEIRMVRTATNEAVAKLSASVGLTALRPDDTPARLRSRAEQAL
ncbi:MAG: GGDEF domain-containing protein, partial [Pseudomonadota bacterium]